MKSVVPTLSQIEEMQDAWKDDYMQNKMLRNRFRVSNGIRLGVNNSHCTSKPLLLKVLEIQCVS